MVEHRYLAEAKEKIDKAVAAYNADVRPQSEIDKLLCDASVTACEALNQFHGEEDIWNKMRQRDRRTVLVALKEIIQQREHFDGRCLPLTAQSLCILGFKPPEEAGILVSMARQACDALNSNTVNADVLVTSARSTLKKLADATCHLASRLGRTIKNQEIRKRWRHRAVKLLLWVSMTLGAAMMTHAITPALEKQLSEAGISAIYLVATGGIENFAREGVEQSQMDTLQAQQDGDENEE